MKKEIIFKEEEFYEFIDTKPFCMYVLASILIMLLSCFYNMNLSLYGVIPLSLANFVGCYEEDRHILTALNVSYSIFFVAFCKYINFMR